MSKVAAIDKYLPPKEDRKNLQAKVKGHLWDQADAIRRKRGVTWNDLGDALLQRLIDEEKSKS